MDNATWEAEVIEHEPDKLQCPAQAIFRTVRTPPALIDPPGAFAPLEEWIEFRDQLRQSGIPRIASILRETDRHIARLRRQATR
jgi:hypothetical protein